MSFIFSRALVEASSLGKCSDTDASAPSNGSPTPKPCLWHDKTMEVSRLSRFGMTCRPLTADLGAELLTSWLAGFRAKTFPLQGRAQELTAPGRACGDTWRGSLAKFDPASSSWRTAQPSLFGDLEESSVTWPRLGMTADGLCLELPMLELRTSANDSGSLLPTPLKSWGRRGPGLSNNLNNLRMSLGSTQQSLEIVKAVGWRWPASFVEWMMGWPFQWTALRPSATDRCPCVPLQPSATYPQLLSEQEQAA